MLGFLERRALPGLDKVEGDRYIRQFGGGRSVTVRLTDSAATVRFDARLDRDWVRAGVRRLFDLDADSAAIDAHLSADPDMRVRVRARGGLRVPGTWSTFELVVRAILGQQVSVERATRLAAGLVERWGAADGEFPAPATLASADVAALGMPGKRGAAIREVAAAFANGLDADAAPLGALRQRLLSVPGIGPWTVEYIMMRAVRDADAFPASDWVIMKELGTTAAGARQLAAAWAPYRAYAVMYLWAAAARRQMRPETRPRGRERKLKKG